MWLDWYDDAFSAVDAFEGLSPLFDLMDEAHERHPNYLVPGITTGGFALQASFNLSLWESYSPADQHLIENAIAAEAALVTAEMRASIPPALSALNQRHGVRPLPFDLGTIDALSSMSVDVVRGVVAGDALANEIADSYYGYLNAAGGGHETARLLVS